jgi:adenylate kinase family enzyme
MGIKQESFIFLEMPSVQEICEAFEKQTGLKLRVCVQLDVQEWEMDEDKLINTIKCEYKDPEYQRTLAEWKARKLTYKLFTPYFRCEFLNVDVQFELEDIKFTLTTYNDFGYVFDSLGKVLWDRCLKKPEEIESTNKSYSYLKKWRDYSWYNRPPK